MREKFFLNRVFDSMDAVEEKLVEAALHFENNPKIVQSKYLGKSYQVFGAKVNENLIYSFL